MLSTEKTRAQFALATLELAVSSETVESLSAKEKAHTEVWKYFGKNFRKKKR